MINKNAKVVFNCDYCNEISTQYYSQYNTQNHHFCNRGCRDNYWKENTHFLDKKQDVLCSNCCVVFKKNKSEIEKYTNHFCSRDCHYEWKRNNDAGDDHPLAKPVFVKCATCGSQIRTIPRKVELQENFFCNKDCQGKYKTKTAKGNTLVDVTCGQCGKDLQVELARYNMYHKRISNPNFFCSEECRGKYWSENYVGENAGMWKGGVTPLQKAVRSQHQYYKWRNECMERDGFVCQSCGGCKELIVHHINPMVNILEGHNITTPAQARECDELWDIHNGITLCEECHKLEHSTRGKIQ